MQPNTSERPNTSVPRSSLEKIISYSLATLAFFVLGYTAVRIGMTAFSTPQNEDLANTEIIIPHQGVLWADFGEN